MIRYLVTLETPAHGRLFLADCSDLTIAAVLAAAVREIDVRQVELRQGQIPIQLVVDVRL